MCHPNVLQELAGWAAQRAHEYTQFVKIVVKVQVDVLAHLLDTAAEVKARRPPLRGRYSKAEAATESLRPRVIRQRANTERWTPRGCRRAPYKEPTLKASENEHPNMMPRHMNNAWTTWSLLCYFMFKPIL